ncbi:FAD-binding oxidoreductase [Ferroplasma sp.]|uniref:FAD-binding oxidoreductase n=1 Tax=Ferroplasma sp. TaxID=2591003 RepID=UPI00307D21D4
MLVPVLYGNQITRDFTEEFNYIENMFGIHTEMVWDGNRNIDESKYFTEQKLKNLFPEGSLDLSIKSRFLHSAGKSSPEILDARNRVSMSIVDGVVNPEYNNIGQIIDILKKSGLKASIFGGGTNVSGCFNMKPGSHVLAIDTSKLNSVSINENMATVGSGTYGPELEKVLNAHGYTCGNFPESFNYSTVGGWVSTRENGQESNQYGGIDNSIIAIKALTSDGIIMDRIVPRESSGLNARSIFSSSEGRYGLIVEATLKTFKLPVKKFFKSYFFKSFENGIDSIKTLEKFPSVMRLSDNTETKIAIESSSNSNLKKLFLNYLGIRGVKSGSLLVVMNNDCKYRSKVYGGISAGTYPGHQWLKDRYSRPGLANILWKHGYVPDTLETSAVWDKLPELYRSTLDKFYSLQKEFGFKGIIMAHLSHMYTTGACIYFTFIILSDNATEDLRNIRNAIVGNFVKKGAAISDHHGAGTYFRHYLDQATIKAQSLMDDGLFSGWQNDQ